jgi:hypothetical protein
MSPIDLQPFVAEASAIYLAEWEGLAEWATHREVTPISLLAWMGSINHHWGNFRTPWGRYATASRVSPTISYNLLALRQMDDELILDCVLHEMGHLFCNHFITPDPDIEDCGHDYRWQNIGAVVGYAWVGCTEDSRRRLYIKAAKRERVLRSMKRALAKVQVAA